MTRQVATIADYLTACPKDARVALEKVLRTIREAVPEAGERISYQIPTFTLDGKDLIYVAAWKNHIGLYPVPPADEALERDLAPYRASKATVRFPLPEPIPHGLIRRLVASNVTRRVAGAQRPGRADVHATPPARGA
jgi:uncharacterized protein YdhG (YjbR/CyaY superfamily)